MFTKIWDYVITTQMCTIIAALSMYGAHLLDNSGLENWNFAVYILLFVGCMFMFLPHLFLEQERNRVERYERWRKAIDDSFEESIRKLDPKDHEDIIVDYTMTKVTNPSSINITAKGKDHVYRE